MTNPLQSPTMFRPASPAANDAARRAALAEADADGNPQFDDLLPGHKAREADGNPSANTSTRIKQWRRAEEAAAVKAQSSHDGAGPVRPVQAASVQQAMLATPIMPDGGADEASAEDTAVDGTTGNNNPVEAAAPNPAELPAIAPHSPPEPGDDAGDDPTMPTGGTNVSIIESSGALHGPNDPSISAASVSGKPPAIRPHGSVNAAANIYEMSFGADVASQDRAGTSAPSVPVRAATADHATASTAKAPEGTANTTIPASVGGGVSSATPMPVKDTIKGEDMASMSTLPNKPTDAIATNALSTTGVFPITTTAQAQLAATTAASTPGAAQMVVPDSGAANLAARIGPTTSKKVGRINEDKSQIPEAEELGLETDVNGTTAAKGQTNVTAYLSTSDTVDEHGNSSQQDADGFAASGLPDGRGDGSPTGRAKDGNAVKASAVTVPAVPTGLAATTATVADIAVAAPSTGIVQVDRVETLLQTVQEAAQKVQFDDSGQIELRVRLEGVADDVAVRVRLDENKQAQVSFQTGSAELRAALEQGWNDLTANGATATANAALNAPDFAAPQPNPDATPLGDSTLPTPGFYQGNRRSSGATVSNGGQSARRLSGYA